MEWRKPLHCTEHKVADEYNVVKTRCEVKDCDSHAVADGFCTIHHPDYIPAARGYSKVACTFLDRLKMELLLTNSIQHVHYDRATLQPEGNEFVIPGPQKYRADGCILATTLRSAENKRAHDILSNSLTRVLSSKAVLIEFLGDIWHGNPTRFDPDDCNHVGARYGDLYDATMERMGFIKDLGYTTVWETDFCAWQKQVVRSLWSYCTVL
jgi:hypothetical protein